jgi:2-polyprenyl-3-methyl-5-hydroxy-6-metoxy-1,4-benzoquinol methylase
MNTDLSINRCRVCVGSLSLIKCIRGEETGEDIAVYKCKGCGSFFSRTEFCQQIPSDISQGSIDGYLNNEDYVRNRVQDILSYSLKRRWVPNDKADFLDIGCGVGWSLVVAEKMGFNTCGVEPMTDASLYANNTLKVNVINSLFRSDLFQDKKFDFIMMDQVLEHVPNPAETLVDAFSLLKPGGLFFLSVPPIDWSRIMLSMSYQLPRKMVELLEKAEYVNKLTALAKKYDAFCYPEGHINNFTTRSIAILAEHCNARLVEQYHRDRVRAKYFPYLKLSTGSFFLRKS